MKTCIAALLMCALLGAPACGGALETYALGGSEADVVHDVAAMADGGVLLAGFTQSHDGTLSDRTKTGWTGWLACVDAQGNTRWNFCSRQGSNDYMRAPVAHADGTITVLLAGNGSERNLIELIRLNARGDVISRKTILELRNKQGQCLIEKPGVFAGGYVLAGASSDEPFLRITYRWFDFEGNLLKTVDRQWDGAVMAVSESHIIEAHDGAYWLCSIDARGNDTRLCKLFESNGRDRIERMTFTSLASLDDGGALACMRQGEDAKNNRLIRFGADGSVVWQLDLGGFVPDDVCAVQGGFAMTGEIRLGECRLYWGDERGNLLGSGTLSRVYEYNEARTLAILADGRAAHAGVTQGEPGSGEWVNYDVSLSIAEKP
ncbi:MAG: hypothetical protein IJ313_14260 [Clostridia bacterium]|nr:hypothetical protein [Clostridia bacterium]